MMEESEDQGLLQVVDSSGYAGHGSSLEGVALGQKQGKGASILRGAPRGRPRGDRGLFEAPRRSGGLFCDPVGDAIDLLVAELDRWRPARCPVCGGNRPDSLPARRDRVCEGCGAGFVQVGKGRRRLYCGPGCARQAWGRMRRAYRGA